MNIKKEYKLTLWPLVMMIFTGVFGFANASRAFYKMGYGAIFWYLLAIVGYFLPYAIMMAEFGSAYKNERGGIYSWISSSVGHYFAFITVFIWYVSYVMWMMSTSSIMWIPFTRILQAFGMPSDTGSLVWQLTNNTQLIGILGISLILLITFAISQGLRSVGFVAVIGGLAVSSMNFVLLIGGLAVLLKNGFHFAQPIEGLHSFVISANGASQNTYSMLAFITFSIFAYGGLEASSGLVDKTDNPSKTFPKALAIGGIFIGLGYSLMIFVIGFFTNWNAVMQSNDVNMGNVVYVVMSELGKQGALAYGASEALANKMGLWVAGFTGLGMMGAYTGAMFTYGYAPLKQLIEGSPRGIWPKWLQHSSHGIPATALWVQAALVSVFIGLNAFAGQVAKQFFDSLVMMTNIAMTLPYFFISVAYIFFRSKDSINKPLLLIKNKNHAMAIAVLVALFILFANIFSVLEPVLIEGWHKGWRAMVLMVAGPIIFAVLASIIYMLRSKNE